MRSLLPLTFFIFCIKFNSSAQGGFSWTQYASGNPAATGVNSTLDISSITSFYGHSIIRERINADVRIKKLHGAVGAGYRMARNRQYYQVNNPYVNYSFHWTTGENSLLAFGIGAEYLDAKYGNGSASVYHGNQTRYNAGVHYQFKGLKIGLAASVYEENNGMNKQVHYEFSDVYIDYTHKFGEKWAVNAAYHSGSYLGSSIMTRAIYKDKFWFGVQAGEGNGEGLILGLNLNDKWSFGYSISAGSKFYDINSSVYVITNQSLSLRFQVK